MDLAHRARVPGPDAAVQGVSAYVGDDPGWRGVGGEAGHGVYRLHAQGEARAEGAGGEAERCSIRMLLIPEGSINGGRCTYIIMKQSSGEGRGWTGME